MALVSRTYDPTDWQLWAYEPVPGKFRLDFSLLNGPDVLGAVNDVGTMAPLEIGISEIEIVEGATNTASVFAQVVGGSMTLVGQKNEWDADFFRELYDGKQVTLTIKNESLYDLPIYGKNTPFFKGRIARTSVNIDPQSKITTFNIQADDLFSNALNVPVNVIRSSTAEKYATVQISIEEAQANNLLPSELNFSYAEGTTMNESDSDTTSNLGELLADYIEGELATVNIIGWGIVSIYSGVVVDNEYSISFAPAYSEAIVTAAGGQEIKNITNLTVISDGEDRPTTFNISNSTNTVNYAESNASYLSNRIGYSAQLDLRLIDIQGLIDKLKNTTSKISPSVVEANVVRTGEQIQFFDNGNLQPYGLLNLYPGNTAKIPASILGEDYIVQIKARRHFIDNTNWNVTYEVWKGL
jgi:hypothetical protein